MKNTNETTNYLVGTRTRLLARPLEMSGPLEILMEKMWKLSALCSL